jgi:hypothetical protein
MQWDAKTAYRRDKCPKSLGPARGAGIPHQLEVYNHASNSVIPPYVPLAAELCSHPSAVTSQLSGEHSKTTTYSRRTYLSAQTLPHDSFV